MYAKLKSIARKILPSETLFTVEPFARFFYAIPFRGKNYQCTVCCLQLKKFILLNNQDLLCPNCGSLPRDRRLFSLLKNEFLKDGIKILDFSPSRCLSRKLKSIKDIDYTYTDLSGNFNANNQYDITNIDIKSDTFDLIVCYHILEHIENDSKAIQELFRVLKSSGKAVIQTPFKEGDTYEDASIISESDRLKHFGQEDHVRIYSEEDLKSRLEKVGFTVKRLHFMESTDTYFGFTDKETILIATKP